MSSNASSQNSMWGVEETGSHNTYTIKNAATGEKLVFQNKVLSTAAFFGTPNYAQWLLEQ